MVESARLEIVYPRKGIEGSNPSLSAIRLRPPEADYAEIRHSYFRIGCRGKVRRRSWVVIFSCGLIVAASSSCFNIPMKKASSRSRKARVQDFTVVFELAEEGGYIAHVPSLPGCSTQGETLEQAKKNAKDAIEGYVVVMCTMWISSGDF